MHAAAEDAGRYTCIVSNTAGEDWKNFDLDVLGNSTHCIFCTIFLQVKKSPLVRLKFTQFFFFFFNLAVSFSLVPPSIVNEGGIQDVRVKEGQNVTLTCEVTGMSSSHTTNTQTQFVNLC